MNHQVPRLHVTHTVHSVAMEIEINFRTLSVFMTSKRPTINEKYRSLLF